MCTAMNVYLHWGPSVCDSSSWLPEPAGQQAAVVALHIIFDLVAESSIWQQSLQFGSRIFNLAAQIFNLVAESAICFFSVYAQFVTRQILL